MDSLKRFFKEEDGAVDLVVIIVLIGIVVVVALIFKDSLTAWVKKMMEEIFGKANQSLENPTTTP